MLVEIVRLVIAAAASAETVPDPVPEIEPDELITAVRVPATGAGQGAAYLKHRHPASSYAVVGVAASVAWRKIVTL